ncbi:MAG: PD-(D/E)XK nuclease family protein, partial [Planktomarina sp.]
LLLPERRIGLSAHDFQQAIGAAEVWVTRSLRSDDAETVPSRWLNRIENLLTGLDDGDQNSLLTKMKSRGAHWTGLAHTVEQVTPEPNQTRPSVAPPSAVRPQRLTVTEIKTLIRDPYSIYAKHVLKLRKLDPLVQTPDAPLRGTVIHNVMAAFTDLGPISDHADGRNRLLNLSRDMLTDLVPWPAARRSWQARITRFADWFVQGELTRQSLAKQSVTEIKGDVTIPKLGFTLAGTADRIDMADDGRAWIYDYKTGNPPSKPEQTYFDKQLLLEVEMARFGAFEGLGPLYVIGADYIGLGAKPVVLGAPIDEADVWTDFTNLIATYQSDDQGYTARRAMLTADAYCDYDHLSRFGEWGTDRPAITTQVT